MQQLMITGNLTRDPEMRFTPQGKAVTDYTVAVNDFDGTTMWVKVTVWEDRAENDHEYLKQGDKVMVIGKLKYDKETGNPETYYSKKANETRAKFEMTGFTVEYLSTKSDGEPKQKGKAKLPWQN